MVECFSDRGNRQEQEVNMQWKDEFSVGVDAFDQDHKILFDLVNQFELSQTTGKSNEHVAAVLDTLVDYTKTHFKREEDMMVKYDYSGLAEHRHAHDRLAKQVEDFCKLYESGDHSIANDLIAFMNNWLQIHILEEDMDYKATLGGKEL